MWIVGRGTKRGRDFTGENAEQEAWAYRSNLVAALGPNFMIDIEEVPDEVAEPVVEPAEAPAPIKLEFIPAPVEQPEPELVESAPEETEVTFKPAAANKEIEFDADDDLLSEDEDEADGETTDA